MFPVLRVSMSFPHHWVPGDPNYVSDFRGNPIGISLRGPLVELEIGETYGVAFRPQGGSTFRPKDHRTVGSFWRAEIRVARWIVSLATGFPTGYHPRSPWVHGAVTLLAAFQFGEAPRSKHSSTWLTEPHYLGSYLGPGY